MTLRSASVWGLVFAAVCGLCLGSVSAQTSEAAAAATTQAVVPPAALERLQKHLQMTQDEGLPYPWEGLEASLQKAPGGRLQLIGYGSLLNRASSARTIKDTPAEGHPPVLAMGARRVFNYIIPEARLQSYGERFSPRERAALNVDYTKAPGDLLNGRLLAISPSDVEELRKREFGYDLRPVACVRWGRWDEAPFTGYVLVAPLKAPNGRQIVDDDALPHPLYAELCRTGAESVSPDFLSFYLRTTFLADRKTSLLEWNRTRSSGTTASSPDEK